jgi:hypothetical protein
MPQCGRGFSAPDVRCLLEPSMTEASQVMIQAWQEATATISTQRPAESAEPTIRDGPPPGAPSLPARCLASRDPFLPPSDLASRDPFLPPIDQTRCLARAPAARAPAACVCAPRFAAPRAAWPRCPLLRHAKHVSRLTLGRAVTLRQGPRSSVAPTSSAAFCRATVRAP